MKKSFLQLLVLIFCFLCVGCENKKNGTGLVDKKVESSSWSFTLRVTGAPWNPLEQILIDTDWDSAYYLNSVASLDTSPNTTPFKLKYKVPFYLSNSERDSVLYLTKKALENFEFAGKSSQYYDGGNVEVTLAMNGKSLECSYHDLDRIQNASPDVEALVEFINKKLSGKVRLE